MAKSLEKSLHKRLFSFSRTEIKAFFSSCTPLYRNRFVTVLQQKLPPEAVNAKMLVVANRKVGKACRRNQLRRQCKSLFLSTGFIAYRVTMVLILRAKCEADWAELQELFKVLKSRLERLNIFSE